MYIKDYFTGTIHVAAREDLRDALLGLFEFPDDEVVAVVDKLVAKFFAGEYIGEEETYLGVEVTV